ncbi:MAG: hypothetical protein IJ188_10000 [Clostridia bacterium]|nr:hypothetical protein [Clostridia bacterium]MBQ9252952.1 hypothetical protein [Clostridia bacterium]
MMELHLLENRHIGGMVSFGTCWNRGEATSANFALRGSQGNPVPAQHEIVAYWPDGSVKWARHTANSEQMGDQVSIMTGESFFPDREIRVEEQENGWSIDAGRIRLFIPKAGSRFLAQEVYLGHELRLRGISPVMELERRVEAGENETLTIYHCESRVNSVSMEILGPVALVVKFTGVYWAAQELMPFTIRMTVGLDCDEIKWENTFFYNGVENRDYVRGFGLRFDAALTGQVWNRHIQFGVDQDVFHEQAQYLYSYHPRTTVEMRQAQMEGQMLEPTELIEAASRDLPIWSRYTLTQFTADSFHIGKQTKQECCVIDAHWGRRAPGAMAVTGENGGVLVGMRDFWQRFPSGLEAENLAGQTACCIAWFRSPQAPAMDYRHYDTRSYWLSNYEGYPDPGASADGIATTSECFLKLTNHFPMASEFVDFIKHTQKPAVYVATPEVYHEKRAFGYWSLPCEDTPEERKLEKLLHQAVEYYKEEIENRHWYGLYDYGDVMHSYDEVRHCWKYDFGGCAWQNTELVPTYWLWLYFLRTGREDVFTLAEAMSRHCSETDVYHFGPKKGIGSRHNIRHWGCSCKEPRVSMAGHHRPLYYLTGDRRIGDYFDEVLSAPESIANLYFFYDTVFLYGPPQNPPKLLIRTGPDWAAFVSDWMTGYERTLNEAYRQKILKGLEGIQRAPMQLASGPSFEFDPATGEMKYSSEFVENIHLTLCMGGPQVWLETAEAIDCPELSKLAADYGQVYLMTDEERGKVFGSLVDKKRFVMDYVAAGLAAYGAVGRQDQELARRAWETLMMASPCHHNKEGFIKEAYGVLLDEKEKKDIPWIATNYVSQWCLNVIMALEFIRDSLPPQAEWDERAAREHNIPK